MEDPAAAAKGAEAGRKDEWPWRKGGTAEYAIFSAAALAAIYFELDAKGSDESKWTSRNGFDESIRDALRLGSRDARDAAHITGTVIMGIMIAAPILEPLATLGFRDARWERQWRTQLINAESFAFTSFFSSMLQNYVARERPFVRNCTPGDCEGHLENRSFPSGHVAFEYTGAGLLCNHHQYQTFYEDPSTGRMVCATGIGLAVADSFLRVISDRHYATDVLMGAAIGLFSGFVLPRWLHYDKPREDADLERGGKEPQVKLIGFAPQLLNKGATLSCAFSY